MKGEAINQLVELIRSGMGLDSDHCVAYNQMLPMPIDSGIFVAVGILDSKPYGASLSYAPGMADDGVTPTLVERQTSNVREVFSIHIMSRDNSARARRQELLWSLTNTASQQAQEDNGFMIARLPVGFADASMTEGAERLNRYVLTMAVLYAQCAERAVDFYDKFTGQPALVTQP